MVYKIYFTDASWFEGININLSAVKRRASELGTKRTVKKQWQVLLVFIFSPILLSFCIYDCVVSKYMRQNIICDILILIGCVAFESRNVYRFNDASRRRYTDKRHETLLQGKVADYGRLDEKHEHARQRYLCTEDSRAMTVLVTTSSYDYYSSSRPFYCDA